MGKMEPGVEFTGSVGNLTAYRMRGVDGIVVRRKGGATKERIEQDHEFARTRENNAEFSGRSAASKLIMRMLYPLKALADYNIAGPLNALLRPIQIADSVSLRGQRSVEVSKSTGLLEGFSLNRKIVFESIVRAPVTANVSRDTMSAEVDIPALMTDINFKPQGKHPLYAFDAVLGLVPDLFFSTDGYKPSYEKYLSYLTGVRAKSDWFASSSGSPAIKLAMKHDLVPPDDHFVLMLSIGIRFGFPVRGTDVQQVKYAGAAKVLRVV